MAFKDFVKEVPSIRKGLPEAKGEDHTLPCYFTPHFFAVETKEGTYVTTQPLTLRQIVALTAEKGYNNSKLYYSETQIKAVEKRKKTEE